MPTQAIEPLAAISSFQFSHVNFSIENSLRPRWKIDVELETRSWKFADKIGEL